MKIVLVEDHLLISDALRLLFQRDESIQVVASFADAQEASLTLDSLDFNLLLTDIHMPGLSCFDLIQKARLSHPRTNIAILSAYWTDSNIERAMHLRVTGLISKDESAQNLLEALRVVHAGVRYYSPEVQERLIIDVSEMQADTNTAFSKLSSLSSREKEVLYYIAKGKSRKQIAAILFISEKTVANHISNVMNKLNIHDRLELALFAIQEGLVPLKIPYEH